MGEATYFAGIKFNNHKEAEDKLPKIEFFLKRMSEAGDRWQDTRGGGKEADDKRRTEFPEVYEILKLEVPEEGLWGKDYSNYCAGLLDSPYGELNDFVIFVRNEKVYFKGTVWHFADWQPLMKAMKEYFGAIEANYVSDEYVECDYFDLV